MLIAQQKCACISSTENLCTRFPARESPFYLFGRFPCGRCCYTAATPKLSWMQFNSDFGPLIQVMQEYVALHQLVFVLLL